MSQPQPELVLALVQALVGLRWALESSWVLGLARGTAARSLCWYSRAVRDAAGRAPGQEVFSAIL